MKLRKTATLWKRKQKLPVSSLVMEMEVSLFIFKGDRVKELECCLAHHPKGNLCLNIWQEKKKREDRKQCKGGGGGSWEGGRDLLLRASAARTGGKGLHSKWKEGSLCLSRTPFWGVKEVSWWRNADQSHQALNPSDKPHLRRTALLPQNTFRFTSTCAHLTKSG